MFYGLFPLSSELQVAFLQGNQKHRDMYGHLLPFFEAKKSLKLSKQKNLSIHSTKLIKGWHEKKQTNIMLWPARIPDPKQSIEIVCFFLSRKVY